MKRDISELDRFKDKITETLFSNGVMKRMKEFEHHLDKHAICLDKVVN